VIPLAAFALMERRTDRLRRFFSLAKPRRRDLALVAVALAVLPALLAVAAAQPVVVHRQWITERLDAQAFIVFDTTQSMNAQSGPNAPTRLDRAKQEADQLIPRMGNIPVGVATMTDRVLPDLMPTTNVVLLRREVNVAVGINQPPPMERYPGRVPILPALFPVSGDNMFAPQAKRRILVVFTDGETPPLSPIAYDLAHELTIPPLFVRVWGPNEHIYVRGRIDPRYQPDPAGASVLSHFAAEMHGHVFGENNLSGLVRAIHAEAGAKPARSLTLGYERSALGPWFLLAGIVPLGFLLYRRNL
jgi:hypothetical protein